MINPIYISKELLNILNINTGNIEYKIHSKFEQGLNISINNKLCFIGNRENGLIPYGILLSKEDLNILNNEYENSKSFKWNNENKCFYYNNIVINLNSKTYSSLLIKTKEINCNYIYSILTKSINMELETGFGKTINNICFMENKQIEFIINSSKSNLQKDFEVLKSFVGLGAGLTPSGDDFLLGMLYVDKIKPFISDSWKEYLKYIFENSYTTDISVNYYRCAYENLFSSDLLLLLESFIEEDNNKIINNVNKILTFGNTSGIDLLSGIIVSIKSLV